MAVGTIVLLNGTSSAGKTSIARALQQVMEAPYLHTGVDDYTPHVPSKFTTVSGGPDPALSDYFTLIYEAPPARIVEATAGGDQAHGDGVLTDLRIGPKGLKLLAAKYRGIAAMAAAGVNVIVVDVIHDPLILRAAVDAFANSDVLFVGLRLPLAVAEQRERERGDRGPGGARLFYDRVHAHGHYDLELATATVSPEACALSIKQALEQGVPRRSFRDLARSFSLEPIPQPSRTHLRG